MDNTARILPGNTQEVVAEIDIDEDKTEEVFAEVMDGNETDRDEVMEVEGNEAVVDYTVGGKKEVGQKEVNGVEVVGKK